MKKNLNETIIKRAKPHEDGSPYNLTDGGGLFLHIKETGRFWRYNYRYHNKRKTLSIGRYPDISLELARKHHEEARGLLARGIDPSQHKQQVKALNQSQVVNSFEAVGREWYLFNLPTWSDGHAKRTISYLERALLNLAK